MAQRKASHALQQLLEKRSVFHWHGVVAKPSHVAQHQLNLLAFQKGYRWFPLLSSEWRGGAYELDPAKLKRGLDAVKEETEKHRARDRGLLRAKPVEAQEAGQQEGRPDMEGAWKLDSAVVETEFTPDNAVFALASKLVHPQVLWEMHPPTKTGTGSRPGTFNHAYEGLMQYYREYLTLVFRRPAFLFTSVTTRLEQYDASFIALYLRFMVESERNAASALRQVQQLLDRPTTIHTVAHGGRPVNLCVKAYKVHLRGRYHSSHVNVKEPLRRIVKGKIPMNLVREYVDYYRTTAQTRKGQVGIKVWLLLGPPSPEE